MVWKIFKVFVLKFDSNWSPNFKQWIPILFQKFQVNKYNFILFCNSISISNTSFTWGAKTCNKSIWGIFLPTVYYLYNVKCVRVGNEDRMGIFFQDSKYSTRIHIEMVVHFWLEWRDFIKPIFLLQK